MKNITEETILKADKLFLYWNPELFWIYAGVMTFYNTRKMYVFSLGDSSFGNWASACLDFNARMANTHRLIQYTVNPKSADFSHAKTHVLYADVWQIHTFGVHRAGVRCDPNFSW